jgi:rhodanese-related sulfurtransferase
MRGLPLRVRQTGVLNIMAKKFGGPAAPVGIAEAASLVANGAIFVDVREAYEHNAEHIEGDVLHPLSALPREIDTGGKPAIFYCRSGARTNGAAARLGQLVRGPSYVLQGGLMAWKRAGNPVAGGDPKAVAGAGMLGRLLAALRGK